MLSPSYYITGEEREDGKERDPESEHVILWEDESDFLLRTEKPDKLIVVDEVTVFYYQTSLLKLKQLCQDVVFFHFSMFVTCCQFWATAETGWYCLQEGRPTEHDLSN